MGVWEEVAGGERPAAGVLDLFLSISSLLVLSCNELVCWSLSTSCARLCIRCR